MEFFSSKAKQNLSENKGFSPMTSKVLLVFIHHQIVNSSVASSTRSILTSHCYGCMLVVLLVLLGDSNEVEEQLLV